MRHPRRASVPKKYQHIDFVPPQSVADAAARGLELRRKASPSNRGGLTPAEASKQGIGSGVQRAVNLKNRDPVSPKVIKQMRSFLARSEKASKISPEHRDSPHNDKGYVAYLLWGGKPAVAWVDKIIRQMEAADEKEKTKKEAKMPSRPLMPLSLYADEILDLWFDAPPRAVAAITEMGKYTDVWERGADRAVTNVLNQMVQGGWQGPDAKRIRKELNSRLNYKRFDRSPAVKQLTPRRARRIASDNEPTNPKLWAKVQALTKGEVKSIKVNGKTVNGPNDGKGFTVFPSAYANGWASKTYKDLGGGWRKKKKASSRRVAARYMGRL